MIPRHYKDRRQEVSDALRQCQLVQLHLLYVLDHICRENNIRYLLEGGTLIGAMRHNGFIPWDDDLDVGMPRADYEKFLKIAKDFLPDDVRLQKPSDTPKIAIPFAKLRDIYSYYGEVRPDMSTADPSGIYIDIFPYDDMPNIWRPLQRFVIRMCSSSWMRTKFYFNKCGYGLISGLLYSVVGFIFESVHFLSRLLITLLNWMFCSEEYCVCFESGYDFPYPKKLLFPVVMHCFEDGEFPVPNDADAILKIQYGNWREIPSPEKRPRHAVVIDPFHANK